jgi:hypothetical protein
MGVLVEWVESLKFFGVYITKDPSWSKPNRKKGTTMPLSPQEAEKIWHHPSDLQNVLQLHHLEHLNGLHHHLV